ncbi:MAG: hypothetical protein H6734_27975 [Alphaproteobacteria bacterium]|nr:hypothetical protein [Alphaproteobacteria bacterium]
MAWWLAWWACRPDDGVLDVGHPPPTETGEDHTGVVVTDPTFGDNLVALGSSPPAHMITATLFLTDTTVAACTASQMVQIYDLALRPDPSLFSTVPLLPPARTRCQHLSSPDGQWMVGTHHGDETGPAWVGLFDVANPHRPRMTDIWSNGNVQPEGVATSPDTVWVAAHDVGLLRFQPADTRLGDPAVWGDVEGNAYAVALGDGRLAVGTVEGEVQVLDLDGQRLATVSASGPVRDLMWLADGTLAVACGSDGLDRIDVDAGTIVAHADLPGSALDVDVLGDGRIAVADWSDLRVFEPDDLALLATEDPSTVDQDAALQGLSARGSQIVAADWQEVRTYAWDPSVSAPDLRLDVPRVDLGPADAGVELAYAVVVRNEGARDLHVRDVSVADPAVTVDRSTLDIAPGGADFLELRWTSDGQPLATTLTLLSDDPDEGTTALSVTANAPGAGVGDLVPDFTYVAFQDTTAYSSRNLGAPALLTYFATF